MVGQQAAESAIPVIEGMKRHLQEGCITDIKTTVCRAFCKLKRQQHKPSATAPLQLRLVRGMTQFLAQHARLPCVASTRQQG